MIIKRWNGSAFVAESPKTTFTDIVADVTAATPVSIFSGGKLKEEYLPASVFGGLRYVAGVGSNTTAEALYDSAQSYVATNGGTIAGCYFMITGQTPLTVTGGTDTNNGLIHEFSFGPVDTTGEEMDNSFANGVVLEPGDWLVIGREWTYLSNQYIQWGIVNNTYGIATATSAGIIEIGSNTSQTVAANAVSATAGRTYASQLNSDGQLVVNVPWVDTNTTYNEATTTTLGLVELAFAKSASSPTLTESTTANRFYGVSLNSSSQMQVNVPWTDTTYSAGTGLTLSGTTFSHTDTSSAANLTAGTRTYVTGLTFDTFGHVTGYTTGTETVVDTNTTYGVATDTVLGLIELFSNTDQTVAANAVTTTAGRTYGIQLNSSDQAVVNVPWTDTTYAKATATTLGLVELFDVAVQSVAANSVSNTASRTYGIQLNSNDQMVVNVPWTDNNTTYSAGNGISLSSTTFSVAAGVGLTQEASGLKMTQPFISSATAPGASFQVADNIWFDIA